MGKKAVAATLAMGAIFVLNSCSAPPELSTLQSAIAAVATRDALGAEGERATATSCWSPAEHQLNSGDEAFRILCRVGFEQGGQERYRDVICVGDPALSPPVDHCYEWAYYRGAPGFADGEPWTPGHDERRPGHSG